MNVNSSSKIGFISFPPHFASYSFALISNRRWNLDKHYVHASKAPLIIMLYEKSVEDLAIGLFACISIESLKESLSPIHPIIIFDSKILIFYLIGSLSSFFWHNPSGKPGKGTTFKYQLSIYSGAKKDVADIWKNAVIRFLRVWGVPNDKRFYRYDLRYKKIFCKIKILKEEIK